MKEKAKTILLAVISPKALILGVAVLNFIVFWKASEDIPGICFICPWYYPWSFTNEPTRLLLAACGLRLGMRWGYLAAIGLSGLTLFQGISFNLNLYRDGMPFESWMGVWLGDPSLHVQYVLAGIIFVYASVCFGRSMFKQNLMIA